MSTGKRLAKRSIVGSRVAAPIEIDLDTNSSGISTLINPPGSPPPSPSFEASENCTDAKNEIQKTAPNSIQVTPPGGINSKVTYYVPGTISKIQNWIHATYYTVSFNAPSNSNARGNNSESFGSTNLDAKYSTIDSLIRTQLPPGGTFKADQLIGPGFGAVSSVRKLFAGQRCFITYKGRETHAIVISHDYHADEVTLEVEVPMGNNFLPTSAQASMTVTRKLDEIRLLESRKSARLISDATDYTLLASGGAKTSALGSSPSDAGDASGRRRSNSISSSSSTLTFVSSSEPLTHAQPHGLKRRTSEIDESESLLEYAPPNSLNQVDTIAMEDVEAALVLMKLGSPKVDLGTIPHSLGQKNLDRAHPMGSLEAYNYWAVANMSGVSPESGVEACSPATPSPPSQEVALITSQIGARAAGNNPRIKKRMRDLIPTEPNEYSMDTSGATFNFVTSPPMEEKGAGLHFNFNDSTTPEIRENRENNLRIFTSQEIVSRNVFQPVKIEPMNNSVSSPIHELLFEAPAHAVNNHNDSMNIAQSSLDEGIDLRNGSLIDPPEICVKTLKKRVIYECTWPGCGIRYKSNTAIERHVRNVHLSECELTEKEEEFYYNELELECSDQDFGTEHESEISNFGSDHYQDEERSPVSNYSSGEGVGEEDSSSSGSGAPTAGARSPGPFVLGTSSAPTWSHLDMARPPHEDPEYQKSLCKRLSSVGGKNFHRARGGKNSNNIPNVFPASKNDSFSNNISLPLNLSISKKAPNNSNSNNFTTGSIFGPGGSNLKQNNSSLLNNGPLSSHFSSYKNSGALNSHSYPSSNNHFPPGGIGGNSNNITHRGTNSLFQTNPTNLQTLNSTNKFMRLDKGQSLLLGSSKKNHNSPSASSPGRSGARASSEMRKCRKVYGMQGRDSWCTQCKWKKACTRFTNGSKSLPSESLPSKSLQSKSLPRDNPMGSNSAGKVA